MLRIRFHRQGAWVLWQRVGDNFFAQCKYQWLFPRVGDLPIGCVIVANVSFSPDWSDSIWIHREGDAAIWKEDNGSTVITSCYQDVAELFGDFDLFRTGIWISDAVYEGQHKLELVQQSE